jgi:hypothetical protein
LETVSIQLDIATKLWFFSRILVDWFLKTWKKHPRILFLFFVLFLERIRKLVICFPTELFDWFMTEALYASLRKWTLLTEDLMVLSE